MQLEAIKDTRFALDAAEAGAVFGGQVNPGRTYIPVDTFFPDGSVRYADTYMDD